MKKIFTLLTALLCTVSQLSWAQLAYDVAFSESDFNNGNTTIAKDNNVDWYNGAIRFTNGTLAWDDQSITIALNKNGIPNTISGNFDPDGGTSREKLTIYAGATSGDISTQVGSTSSSGDFSYTMPKDAKFIKLVCHGNFKRRVKNLVVSELVYFNAPKTNTFDFGAGKVYSETLSKTTTADWCNTPAMNAEITGDGAHQFTVSISNNSSKAAYGTATVTVTYAHNVVGADSATLTLSNGTFTHTITLSGVTEKKDQFIVWSEDIENNKLTLPVGKEMSNAATATSELAVTYTSSDENVVAITNGGTSFKAVGAGTAVITATQAGNDTEWNAVSDFITVTVTEKKIQYIQWTDNLSRLLVGDAPLTLTAKVQTVDAEGTRTDAPERDQYLTYTSGDANIVTVEGNVLTIVGEGTTTLTASVSGDDNYEEATATMSVRVRTASAGCEDVLVDGNLTGGEVEFFQLNTDKIEKTYAISRSNGVPNKLSFDHKGGKWFQYYGGNIEVRESTDGGNTWSSVLWSQEPTAGTYNNSGEIQLSRNATHVKFTRPKGGTGYHYIKDVVITPAQYLESAQAAIVVDKSIIGDKIERELVINYSNVKAELVVSHNDIKNVSVNEQYLGNKCGAFGSATLHITIVPTAVGTLLDTIRVKDEVSGMAVAVPVEVQTQRNTQTITWEGVPSSILTTDEVTLTASAQTAVSFSSSDETIAYVGAENQLVVVKAGEVTITATAAQDDKYEEATLSKTITIALATPMIIAAPTLTVESIGYGEPLTNDMLVGGEASVAGVFTWNIADDADYLPGTHEVPVLFTPENTDWYATAETTVSVLVTKKTQTITWNFTTTIISVGDTLILDATATSGYAVTYDLDPTDIATLDGNKLTAIAAGTLTITANQNGVDEEGNQNYYAATPISFTITIASTSTGNGLVITEVRAQKVVHNGEVVIIRGEEVYNMRGQRVE